MYYDISSFIIFASRNFLLIEFSCLVRPLWLWGLQFLLHTSSYNVYGVLLCMYDTVAVLIIGMRTSHLDLTLLILFMLSPPLSLTCWAGQRKTWGSTHKLQCWGLPWRLAKTSTLNCRRLTCTISSICSVLPHAPHFSILNLYIVLPYIADSVNRLFEYCRESRLSWLCMIWTFHLLRV